MCFRFISCKWIPPCHFVSIQYNSELSFWYLTKKKFMKNHRKMLFEIPAHCRQSFPGHLAIGMFVAQNAIEFLPENHRAGCLFERGPDCRIKILLFYAYYLPFIGIFDMFKIPASCNNIRIVRVYPACYCQTLTLTREAVFKPRPNLPRL